MKNHLHKNYKWLLVLQYSISWIIATLFLGGMIFVPLLGAASQGNAAASALIVVSLVLPLMGLVAIFFLSLWIASWWYKNYTYELTDTVFKKEFGILTRRNTNIPYERIQNVDIVSPLLYRIFGIAQLNIQTAGGSSYATSFGGAEGRLPGVSKETALELQAELLKRARLHNPQAPRPTGDGL